jgi:hypothetical protein
MIRGEGRWLSPDPLGGDVTNPQSLNRYACVMNNPTTFVDPLGLLIHCPFGQTNNQCNVPYVSGFTPNFLTPFITWFWGGGGGGGSTPPPPKPAPPASKVQPQPCGNTGFGGGMAVGFGGSSDLGAGLAGATGTGSVGVGIFYDSGTGISGGAFASGGAAAYALGYVAGAPTQATQPLSFLAYAGAGPTITFTNARSVQQLSGPFTTVTVNVGFGPVKGSVQLSFSNGIYELSIGPPAPYVSPGIGASVSKVSTNTVTTHTGCGGAGG